MGRYLQRCNICGKEFNIMQDDEGIVNGTMITKCRHCGSEVHMDSVEMILKTLSRD